MVFYKILKNNILIGIGFTKGLIPPNCKTFYYLKITQQQYNIINKKEFNAK